MIKCVQNFLNCVLLFLLLPFIFELLQFIYLFLYVFVNGTYTIRETESNKIKRKSYFGISPFLHFKCLSLVDSLLKWEKFYSYYQFWKFHQNCHYMHTEYLCSTPVFVNPPFFNSNTL